MISDALIQELRSAAVEKSLLTAQLQRKTEEWQQLVEVSTRSVSHSSQEDACIKDLNARPEMDTTSVPPVVLNLQVFESAKQISVCL